MAQYSARFIPNFAEMTTPLRDLTHQGAKWRWSQTEQAAFEKLKDTLSSETVLGYYETGQDTKLLVDAGPNGLGLVLMQKKPQGWKAVECASRSLTEVEKRYPQIDREAFAIRSACERCYKYLIGSSFVIETDHQPLIPLFNNPHSTPPMRIERWLLYLQQFDYQLKYCPGKQNAADYLSRHMLPLTESDIQASEARKQIFTGLSPVQHPMPSLWLIFKQQRGRTRISGSSFRLFRLAIIVLANLILTWRSTHWCSTSSVI